MRTEYLSDTPKLSVVVCVVSDAVHLKGCLEALHQQADAPAMEIIVPYHAKEKAIGALASLFPQVVFHPVEYLRTKVDMGDTGREHHDELRAIGLRMARGDIVALIEDHGCADKYWAKGMMEAHEIGHVAVGGAIENGIDRPLNWAVYYSDFGRYQNPVPEGPAYAISDANISYKRCRLEDVRDVWMEAFHETSVNGILMARGETLWLSPKIVVFQHRIGLTFMRALRERYVWGRSYAGTRAQENSFVKRIIYLILSPMLPAVLLVRKSQDALIRKRNLSKFAIALPLTFLLSCVWSAGEFMGYLTGRQHRFVTKG